MTVGELIWKLKQVSEDSEVVNDNLQPVEILFCKGSATATVVLSDALTESLWKDIQEGRYVRQ